MAPAPTASASATDKPIPASRDNKVKKKDASGSSKEKKDGTLKKKKVDGDKRKGESGVEGKGDEAKTHRVGLKGSAKLVAEFFEYSINSILFQRGVYPPEDFTQVKKYGLNMLVSNDDQVKAYIKKIMSQLNKWMTGGKISKLVVVITSKETGEHVERWQFDVQIHGKNTPQPPTTSSSNGASTLNQENTTSSSEPQKQPTPQEEKSEPQIQSEIQAIFRQITASVTFLPTLDAQGPCTFNVLVYADADSEVPLEWGDSDAKEIENAESVRLRGFSTTSHRVEAAVSYRLADA
ncbi:MAG: Mitotic spindle checkpoint component mad2 [Alyxoria varia]|nr:MAG: Mitotic spindle checkpoint component mad2 [Alyxoria varia]